MASIQKIENKKGISYKIRICCGYDLDGKKIVKCTTYVPNQLLSSKQQEKELQKFAFEFEEKIKDGISFDAQKMSFEEFANDWLERSKNNITYNSYKCYEMMLRTKITPYFKTYKIGKIKLPMIEAFYATLIDDYAQSTIKKYDMLLTSMFKTAIRWQMIEKNPCTGAVMPKSHKKSSGIKYFTPNQARVFLNSLDMDFEFTYKGHTRVDDTGVQYSVGDYIERRKISTQIKVFFYIATTCGMRRGEILALCWDDIDFDAKTISITKSITKAPEGVACKEPKTATSMRKIPMPEFIVPLVKQYQCEYENLKTNLGDKWQGNGNVFIQADGKLMGVHTPYQRFVSHIDRYNEWVEKTNETLQDGIPKLEPLPQIPFHGLRHTCATLLNDMGTNISIISKTLGHAQTSTTMNIYAHSFESQLRQASNNMDDFLYKSNIRVNEQRAVR